MVDPSHPCPDQGKQRSYKDKRRNTRNLKDAFARMKKAEEICQSIYMQSGYLKKLQNI